MSLIDQTFRLAKDASSLGLTCDLEGCSLAGVPLLDRTPTGFAPRPVGEIGALMKSAYGQDIDPKGLSAGLKVIAKALNQGDVGRAMIAALQLKLPELSWCGAVQLTKAHFTLAKGSYNPDEPRDERGRWTTGDASPDSLKPIPIGDVIPFPRPFKPDVKLPKNPFRGLPDDFDDNCLAAGRNCIGNALDQKDDPAMFSNCQKMQTVCHGTLILSRFSPDTEFFIRFPDNTIVSILDGQSSIAWINGIKVPKIWKISIQDQNKSSESISV